MLDYYRPTETLTQNQITITQPSPYQAEASKFINDIQSRIARPKYDRMLLDAEQLVHQLANGVHDDSIQPTRQSIERALLWLSAHYHDTLSAGLPWAEPHVTQNESGAVVFEWSRKTKRLAIYASESELWYLRSWGANTATEMEDGDLTTSISRQCWMWLMQ